MDYGNIMLTNMPRTGSPIIGNPYVYDRVEKLDNVSSISFRHAFHCHNHKFERHRIRFLLTPLHHIEIMFT